MAKGTTMKATAWLKSSTDDKALDIGPEVSPYTSSSCRIYFKSEEPFMIPRDLIRASAELDKVCGAYNSDIHIKEIPDEAGHVLVHYLHTGTWQTLRQKHSLQDSKTSGRLGTSITVYAAARAYGLPGLAELAKVNISKSADKLPASEVITLAAGACELLPDDDLWFLAFIKLRIGGLLEEPSFLNHSTFLECFGTNKSYSKILVKSLVGICCEKSISLKRAESAGPRIPSSLKSSTIPESEATPQTDSQETTHESVSEHSLKCAPEIETEISVEVAAEPEPIAWGDPIPEPELAAKLTTEPRPEISAEFIPVPDPEPEPTSATDYFELLGAKKTKKTKKKNKKGKTSESQEEVCVFKATHLMNDEWEDCSSCRKYVGSLMSSYHQPEAHNSLVQ